MYVCMYGADDGFRVSDAEHLSDFKAQVCMYVCVCMYICMYVCMTYDRVKHMHACIQEVANIM